ncbi:zinc finger protein 572-like [Galendromus occidentalis]|uniref:Zinc finger protein 572-like n=1 Tax=Galendromus occidentalis TaxID=34638 RepID=A0AAJ6VXH4_9ACAR|nr:zinc finger protein 572-like [Galendromus occidentalis]
MNGFSPIDLLQLTMVSQDDDRPASKEHEEPNEGEPYYCPLCSFSTHRPGLLLRHTFEHTGVQPYSCWKCNQRFTLPETLVDHFISEHSIKGQPLKCSTCRKTFSTRRGLIQHQLQYTIEKSRFCYYCAKGFGSDSAEKEHQRSHSPGVAECWMRCPACRKSFPNEDALRIHSVFHLKLSADRFIAPDPGMALANHARKYFQARKHSQSSSLKRRRPRKKYSCEHCDKVYVSKMTLRWHERHHRLPFSCRACTRSYSTLCALLAHAADHDTISSIEEEQLRFQEKIEKKTGLGGVNTATPIGGLGALQHHPSIAGLSASLGVPPVERHECPTCGKAFGSANSLRAHKKSHTTGKTPHKCPTCGKQFVRSYDMKRHMRTHDSSAPYICQICQQKFSQSSSLKKHYKTHRIHCPLCLKQFDLPEQLQQHVSQCPAQQAQQSLLAAAISNMNNIGGLNGMPPEALAGLMQAAQGIMSQPSTSQPPAADKWAFKE